MNSNSSIQTKYRINLKAELDLSMSRHARGAQAGAEVLLNDNTFERNGT